MADNTSTGVNEDRIVRVLRKKGRRACAAELANAMDPPVPPKQMYETLRHLEREGLVRALEDERATEAEQTVFQLVA